jgi:hypothetical protein
VSHQDDTEISQEVPSFSLAEMATYGAPTRADDTVVLSGGRRATKDEVLAYIAADVASRCADG